MMITSIRMATVGVVAASLVGPAYGNDTIDVPATANIYGAGHAVPPGGGTLPVESALPAGTGRVLQFASVTGSVQFGGGGGSNGPDGVKSACGQTMSLDGIAGVLNTGRGRNLFGVFLDDTEPADPAPPRIDFGGSVSFPELSPEIAQMFFIGDGLTGTGSGDVQVFHIPDGATRLFFGLRDGTACGGPPGGYADNSGSLTAVFTVNQSKAIELSNTNGDDFGYVRIADDPALEPQQFTLEAWITPLGPGWGNTDLLGAMIVAKPWEGGVGGMFCSYYVAWVPTDEIVYVVVVAPDSFPDNWAVAASTTTVSVGTTAHVAATFDGAMVRLYINGQFESEAPFPWANVYYGTEDVLIGAANFAHPWQTRFQGVIDDVRIWDHARDEVTIAGLKDWRLCGDEPGLPAYYSFDDGLATDDSGNGHVGVFEGGMASVDSSTATVPSCKPPPPCLGDLDGDGSVGINDLFALLAAWGPNAGHPADFNGDGTVGILDLLTLLASWGPCS